MSSPGSASSVEVADALRSVIEHAVAESLEPTQYEYAVQWWEPYSDSGATARVERRVGVDYSIVARVLSVDGSLATLREVLSKARSIPLPEFVTDETAETIVVRYLSALGSVSVCESTLADIAAEYTSDVQSDEFAFETTFQVSHFSAHDSFDLDEHIRFRPVSSQDIEHFGYEPLPVRSSPRLNTRDWICEVVQTYRVDDVTASHSSRTIWDSLIGSLGIAREGDAWFSLLREGPRSPYLRGQFYGSERQMHSSPHGNAVALECAEAVTAYRESFQTAQRIRVEQAKNLNASFRRFRAAAGRESIDDKLTDLVIAIESLLVPDGGTGEVGYKFRIRGAAVLSEFFGANDQRIRLLRDLYDARSKVVHEGKTEGDNLRHMQSALAVFRRVFNVFAHSDRNVRENILRLDAALVGVGASWLE